MMNNNENEQQNERANVELIPWCSAKGGKTLTPTFVKSFETTAWRKRPFGERMKSIRMARGYSLNKLKDLLGITHDSLVYRFELTKNPHRETVRKIAEALEVPPEILI